MRSGGPTDVLCKRAPPRTAQCRARTPCTPCHATSSHAPAQQQVVCRGRWRLWESIEVWEIVQEDEARACSRGCEKKRQEKGSAGRVRLAARGGPRAGPAPSRRPPARKPPARPPANAPANSDADSAKKWVKGICGGVAERAATAVKKMPRAGTGLWRSGRSLRVGRTRSAARPASCVTLPITHSARQVAGLRCAEM